ncbi:hypothetical protein DPEC_G00280870 [Dallia pectoralis]|uniref:Uncharacterized protein n=1 Tax=Dallia pectoralis TaxID=75939 RepID=A0ACC2FMN2_DALPE|nr:hypothetical protein DPEC_G00280870 [Dallia pectoralis]
MNMLSAVLSTIEACPTVILNLFDSKGPQVMGFFLGTAVLLILAVVCSSLLSKEIKRSQSSPPGYVLMSTTSVLSHPYSDPNQDPVVFTPLPASIHVADSL